MPEAVVVQSAGERGSGHGNGAGTASACIRCASTLLQAAGRSFRVQGWGGGACMRTMHARISTHAHWQQRWEAAHVEALVDQGRGGRLGEA